MIFQKIESVLIDDKISNNTEKMSLSMKPIYLVNPDFKYCSIEYLDKKYILDVKQFNKILNFDKSFKFYNETDDYPAYGINNKKINYLEFLYGLNLNNYLYIFKNHNKYDLREENVSITDNEFKLLVAKYNVLEYMNNAKLITMGKYSGQYKNPMCKILTTNNELELLMLCNKDILCILCPKSYEKILEYENANSDNKIIWSCNSNGFILDNNLIYMHEVIMDCYKENKKYNVKHIDKNPLNNIFTNLNVTQLDVIVNDELILKEPILKKYNKNEYNNDEFEKIVQLAKYNVIEFMNNATLITMGKYAGQYKNPMCKILNQDNKIEILMLCNQNILCRLCEKSYEKILEHEKNHNDNTKIVWSYQTNGYILGNNNLYIHQVIMDCYGNGKGTKEISVDHIDQDPLNNTFANLRLASRKDQEDNTKGIKDGTKRARKHNAKDLPSGITQDMMRKYVVYYEECYDKANDLHREFFKIESHPKLDKIYISSKSNKVSIQTKLAEVNKVVDELDNDIFPIQDDKQLPTYITLKITRDKPHLVFDKKCDDGRRLNFKMVLRPDYKLDEMLPVFREKIKEKYDIVV